jgi:sensor domain CHASE-containing protein
LMTREHSETVSAGPRASSSRKDVASGSRKLMYSVVYSDADSPRNAFSTPITVPLRPPDGANPVTAAANHVSVAADHVTVTANPVTIAANPVIAAADHITVAANYVTAAANHVTAPEP